MHCKPKAAFRLRDDVFGAAREAHDALALQAAREPLAEGKAQIRAIERDL
jgi:hypothetical protein